MLAGQLQLRLHCPARSDLQRLANFDGGQHAAALAFSGSGGRRVGGVAQAPRLQHSVHVSATVVAPGRIAGQELSTQIVGARGVVLHAPRKAPHVQVALELAHVDAGAPVRVAPQICAHLHTGLPAAAGGADGAFLGDVTAHADVAGPGLALATSGTAADFVAHALVQVAHHGQSRFAQLLGCGGQLEGDLDVTGFARGAQNYAAGSNDLRSQFLAGYATWRNAGGTYVDTVLQAGRLRYTANPAAAASAEGKGSSVLASVEVGQALQIAPGWTVEPQLQLASQHMDLDDVTLAGATVQQDNDSTWLARIGVRVKGEIATSAGLLQPYARVNVYRRSSGTDTARFIGPAATTDIVSSTGGTSTELAVGATWQITPLVAAYGEVGRLWANSGTARTEGSLGGGLGLKVNW